MHVRTQTESHNKACNATWLEISKFNHTTNHGHGHTYVLRMKNTRIDVKVRQVAVNDTVAYTAVLST